MLATQSIFEAPVAFSYVSARVTTAFSYEDRYASLAFLLVATAFSFRSATRLGGLLHGLRDRVGLRLRGHCGFLSLRIRIQVLAVS